MSSLRKSLPSKLKRGLAVLLVVSLIFWCVVLYMQRMDLQHRGHVIADITSDNIPVEHYHRDGARKKKLDFEVIKPQPTIPTWTVNPQLPELPKLEDLKHPDININKEIGVFDSREEAQMKSESAQWQRAKYNRMLRRAAIKGGGTLRMMIPTVFRAGERSEGYTDVIDRAPRHKEWQVKHLGRDQAAYRLNSLTLPTKNYYPDTANGHLGTTVFSDYIYMNGLYSGSYNASHRAAIPSWTIRNITGAYSGIDGVNLVLGRRYTLDVSEGVFTQTVVGKEWVAEQRVYAHREFTPLFVHEVDVQRTEKRLGALKVDLGREGRPEMSQDLKFTPMQHPFEKAYGETVVHMYGKTKIPENKDDMENPNAYQSVHIFYTPVPDSVELPPNVKRAKFTYLLSADKNELVARHHMLLGLALLAKDHLYLSHLDAWRSLWEQGRVTLDGDTLLASIVLTSQFNLLSNLPSNPHKGYRLEGVCPGGIARGGLDTKIGYRGHVYWDQDIWILPALLPLHPDLVRLILDSRIRKIPAARKIAKQHGFKGIQFPWESARTGMEVTWDQANTLYQHHVTGDVAVAALHYMYATNDTQFLLKGSGMQLFEGIAQFWRSRVVSVRKQLEIHNVMGPDEYNYPVHNSAYTNAVAKLALNATLNVWNFAQPHNREAIKQEWLQWSSDSKRVYIPFNYTSRYHPQFDGYKIGTRIKQADAVLLAYPLDETETVAVHQRDLQIYGKVVSHGGPCMTWAIHAIGWLELKDQGKAWDSFKMQLMHRREPFNVWSEFTSGGRHFITGAGGFMQSIINGYFGLRYRSRGLYLDPILIPKTKGMHLTDLDYLGSQLDVEVGPTEVQVTLTGYSKGAQKLMVKVLSTGAVEILEPVRTIHLPRTRLVIRASGRGSWTQTLVPQPVAVGEHLLDDDLDLVAKRTYKAAERDSRALWEREKKLDEDMVIRARKLDAARTPKQPHLEEVVAQERGRDAS